MWQGFSQQPNEWFKNMLQNLIFFFFFNLIVPLAGVFKDWSLTWSNSPSDCSEQEKSILI